MTDGTPEATQLVRDIFPGADSGFGRTLQDFAGAGPETKIASLGAVAVLAANDGLHGTELWVTDGTSLGTGLLRDIYPGDYPSTPRHFTRLGNRIVFSAEDEEHGLELWVTDGTYPGTVLLKDVAPGLASSVPDDLVVRDGVLYFSAWSPNYGREAWQSDGTTAGTVRISDVAPGPLSSSPQRFARAGNRLYFSATDQVHGYELWALSDDGSDAALPRRLRKRIDQSLVGGDPMKSTSQLQTAARLALCSSPSAVAASGAVAQPAYQVADLGARSRSTGTTGTRPTPSSRRTG